MCPNYSLVIGTACICLSESTMQNGECVCKTAGAFVSNSVCTCGVNGINISNSCSCPSGASLVNGVCTCSNVNAYVLGNSCVCPTYSQLVGNTCTCPSNSIIENNICTCNQISGQTMNNGECQCLTNNAFVDNGTCICGLNALNKSNICTCPTNSSLVNNICTCDKIIGQQIINGTCQCQFGQSVVNDSCYQTNYVINILNFECSMEIFTQQFDIKSITNSFSSQSTSYLFSASMIIENAFIDISDNVYTTTVYPLFQAQETYTNLKIQFGTQSLNSGSFIQSTSISMKINQMNIISRSGSQLYVQTDNQLNILTSTSTNTQISNFLINLSFVPSYGNITLVNNINGIFNVYGYQVLGSYISTMSVAMVGLNLYNATVTLNQASFRLDAFHVGNCSSYLFGFTKYNTIMISKFSVILGNNSNYQLLCSIQSSIPSTYRFGGIVAQSSDSIIHIDSVILDSYQHLSTNYVLYSGFLIGYIFSNTSCIQLSNMCLQQSMTSNYNLYYFGIIGGNEGNTSLQNASIIFQVQVSYVYCFGIIGYQQTFSLYSEVINLTISMSLNSTSGIYVGSIFGAEEGLKSSIQNTSVIGGKIISGSERVGGFIGQNQYTTMTIQNSTTSQTNISGISNIGGFVGYCFSPLNIINSKIILMRLQGQSIGIVIGYNTGIINFSSSISSSNYFNDILLSDCAILSNWQLGC
ncbi:Conserved_hypothetical protein [Hexamita inflata]|uniref:Uncharacterized protein n=1 Tax=Hexamita inflata TaxID=28002 RepID=A0ABP1HPV8_9EUKA